MASALGLAFVQCSKEKHVPQISEEQPRALEKQPVGDSPLKQSARSEATLLLDATARRLNQTREFRELSADEKDALIRLKEEFWRTAKSERRLALLEEIEATCYGEELAAFAADIFRLGDESLSLRAVEMLAGNTSSIIVPALEEALRDASEEVRLRAATAANEVRDDVVVGYLGKVFADSSANVRLSGLNGLDAQTESRRFAILREAFKVTAADVQKAAIDTLQVEWTRKSVEVLFDALDSANAEVRSEAQFSIGFMLEHEFISAAEARAWWRENEREFDYDLVRKQ